MKHLTIAGGLLAASLLSGCGNLPEPDYFVPGKPGPAGNDTRRTTFVHVEDLVRHIECRLALSNNLAKWLTYPDPLKSGEAAASVAQVTLTLKVDDNGGLSPSLSFINPLTTGGTFAFGLNGNLNLDRQKIFTTTYIIDLNRLAADSAFFQSNCADGAPDQLPSLSGDLGLDGILAAALAARTDHKYYLPADPSKNLSPMPSFGTTVQFTLTANFDTGPSWTLVDIKGPSGSKGIVNGGVVDTDTMVIAITTAVAPSKAPSSDKEIADIKARLAALERKRGPQLFSSPEGNEALLLNQRLSDLQTRQIAPSSGESATQSAAAAAQALTNNMILQNLTSVFH